MQADILSFPLGSIADEELTYAVSVTFCNGAYVFVRHRDRRTWECPGGHIEPGESPIAAAHRELWEETGAHAAQMTPLCIYRVDVNGKPGRYGLLCRAEIAQPGHPESEIAQVRLFTAPPEDLTYPHIVPWLIRQAQKNAGRGL